MKVTEIPFEVLPKQWIFEQVSDTEIHVYPEGDWRIHTLTDHCLCGPAVRYQSMGRRVIHNSFDGRETDEKCTPDHIVN